MFHVDDVNCVVLSDTCVSKPSTKASDEQFVSQDDLFVGTHFDMSGNPSAKSIKEILLVGIGKHLVPSPASNIHMVGVDGKVPVLVWLVSSIIPLGVAWIAADG